MRNSLAVVLALMLSAVACASDTSSIDTGSVVGTAANPADAPTATRAAEEPPEPPPEDAVVLIVDGEGHQARLTEPGEVHWYRFEARAGQDYLIFSRPQSGPVAAGAETAISLHDTAGMAIEVTEQSDSGRIDWKLLRGAEAATYHIRVVSRWPEHAGQYAVAVRAVDDGHGDTAAEGTEIELGTATELAGTFDYWGDADWFVFEAQGGETFHVHAGSLSPEFYKLSPVDDAAQGGGEVSAGPRIERSGTGGLWNPLNRKPWHLAESGLYGLRLVGSVDSQGFPQSYTATFELLTDDHANVPPAATSLQLGRSVAGSLDYGYDEDWFSVDLAAPKKYVIEVLSAEGKPTRADVSLFSAGSTESYRSHLSLEQDELVASQFGRVIWQARESGEHLIQLAEDGSGGPGRLPVDYLVRVSPAPADDHADGPQGATVVAVGEWVEGIIDEQTDTDWFGFRARSGAVYTVEHEEFDTGSGGYVPIDEDYPWNDVYFWFVASGHRIEARRGVVAETAGDLALKASGSWGNSTRYRFRIVAHEQEDYSDDRTGALSITMADAVRGSASDQDVDWFVLDTPEAGIYSAGVRTSPPVAFSVSVYDEDGQVESLYAGTRFDREPSGSRGAELWRAPAGGRFWVRVTGKWQRLFHYQLLLDYSDAADDHGNSAEDATVVVFDPASVPAEVDELEHRRGRSAAEVGAPQVVIEGEIGKYVDEDWFALPVQEGVKYLIQPYVPGGRVSSRPNFFDDGRFLLWDGEEYVGSWSGWRPPIGFVPTVTGTYHVQVGDYLLSPHSGPWTYGFEVAVLPPDAVSDTREGASIVSVGDAVESVLDTQGDLDWYLIEAVRGQTWLLESPSDRWGCVEVHGPSGTGVVADQCGESRLIWSAPVTGRYGIRVSGHWTIRVLPSEYRFTLSLLDPDDHGNDAPRASALVPGRTQSGVLDYLGDVDVFRLPVAAGDVWVLNVTRSNYRTDFLAEFLPEDGEAGSGRSPRIDDGAYLPAQVAGSWLISVSGKDSLGDYTLTATRWAVPDDYGDSRREAHAIAAPERPESKCGNDPGAVGCPAGTTVTGSSEYPGDSDYFRLQLVAGRKYALSVEGAASLAVLAEDGCVAGVRGTWEVESSGSYWVRVSNPRQIESPQDYVLYITRLDDDWVDPWVDPWDLATQLEPGEIHADTLEGDGERHYYRVRLDHPSYLLELHGDVWDSARSPNHRGTAYSREDSQLISQLPHDPPVVYEFTVVGSGEYSVVVREWSEADSLLGWNSRHGDAVASEPAPFCAAESG